MVVDSGETTAQAETRSSSAEARMVRSAVPVAGPPAYSALMLCKRAQGIQVGGVLQIVDRSSADQVRSPVSRAAIGIHDYGAFAGKILQQAGTDGLHHLTDGGGIVVGGHTYKNIRLADIDQLAKKLIRKNAFLGQILPPLELPAYPISDQSGSQSQILRRRNQ